MKVCTTKQLAAFYGGSEDNIQDNYRNNADRFIDGVHFVRLEGSVLRQFKSSLTGNNQVSHKAGKISRYFCAQYLRHFLEGVHFVKLEGVDLKKFRELQPTDSRSQTYR